MLLVKKYEKRSISMKGRLRRGLYNKVSCIAPSSLLAFACLRCGTSVGYLHPLELLFMGGGTSSTSPLAQIDGVTRPQSGHAADS